WWISVGTSSPGLGCAVGETPTPRRTSSSASSLSVNGAGWAGCSGAATCGGGATAALGAGFEAHPLATSPSARTAARARGMPALLPGSPAAIYHESTARLTVRVERAPGVLDGTANPVGGNRQPARTAARG